MCPILMGGHEELRGSLLLAVASEVAAKPILGEDPVKGALG